MSRGKYKEWVKPDGLMRIKSWARDGLTDEQISKNIGIARNTLFTWRKKYPEIEEALSEGKRPIDLEVENSLLKRALGGWVEEQDTIIKQVGSGETSKKITKHKRYVPPDTIAAIFWLKNRKPNQWQRVSENESKKLEFENKKLEVELLKLNAELEQIKENKGTEIIIVDEWSVDNEENS